MQRDQTNQISLTKKWKTTVRFHMQNNEALAFLIHVRYLYYISLSSRGQGHQQKF